MPGNRNEMIGYLEQQGAVVRKSKKGLFIRAGGGTVTVHNTPSDRRSTANEIAEFRRIGLRHPLDKREGGKVYPKYVFGKVTKRTEESGRTALGEMGWPLEVTVPQLRLKLGLEASTAGKLLYQIGYRWHPEEKKRGHSNIWVAPEDIKILHEQWEQEKVNPPAVPVKLIEKEPEPAPQVIERHDLVMPIYEESEAEPGVEHIEFIDERDSWVVDPEELLGQILNSMFQDRMSTLRAVGIEYEIRVWRKKEA